MSADGDRQRGAPAPDDREIWRQSKALDLIEDEAERFLDLAAFADGRLDSDERDRVAELVAADPAAAGDVDAARAAVDADPPSAAVIANASALVEPAPLTGTIIPFGRPGFRSLELRGAAGWAGLAAAMALAGWFGFALGMDTSLSVARTAQPNEDGFLQEVIDPAPGFLRDFVDGPRT